MSVNFTPDLELVRIETGFQMKAHTPFGRSFLSSFIDTYENADQALHILSKALKQKCRVVINIPITPARDGS